MRFDLVSMAKRHSEFALYLSSISILVLYYNIFVYKIRYITVKTSFNNNKQSDKDHNTMIDYRNQRVTGFIPKTKLERQHLIYFLPHTAYNARKIIENCKLDELRTEIEKNLKLRFGCYVSTLVAKDGTRIEIVYEYGYVVVDR